SQLINMPVGVTITSAKVKFTYTHSSGTIMIDTASFALGADVATSTPTFTPDPNQQRLLASDGTADDYFGYAVAFSGDGNTLLVSARNNDFGDRNSQGSVLVFVRSGSAWTEQAQLWADDGAAGDKFGHKLALSADGNTALISAYGDDIGENRNQGSAYIFTRSGATWTQQAKLVASDGGYCERFGSAVALSADGTTALIGAERDYIGTNWSQGSAYVFTRSGTTWTRQDKLKASDGADSDYFGNAVALSSDGSIALIGAYWHVVGFDWRGAAYVFTRSGTTWTEQTKLISDEVQVPAQFGRSVALNSAGDTAIIGARSETVGDTGYYWGAAYIFTRSSTTWTQQARLVLDVGGEENWFGESVALSADGSTALVGEPRHDVGGRFNQGAAYLFTRTGSTWALRQKLLAHDGASDDRLGFAVALSGDGSNALVGAHRNDIGTVLEQGAAYSFALTP
ncbi:MAG: FG-GAP repeat protein, partial [Armatimonadetes bacterium]|nr:FG-GAP repeat protein [Anaerolineae bacterium]